MFDTKQNTSVTMYHLYSIPHTFYWICVILLLRRSSTMWAKAFDCGSVNTQYFGRTVSNTIYNIIIDVHNLIRSSYYYGRPRIVFAGVYIYHIFIVIIIIHRLSPGSGPREDIFARQFLFSKTEQSRGVPNDDKSTFDDYYVRTIHNTIYKYIKKIPPPCVVDVKSRRMSMTI